MVGKGVTCGKNTPNLDFHIYAHTVKDLVSASLSVSAVGSSDSFVRNSRGWVPLFYN